MAAIIFNSDYGGNTVGRVDDNGTVFDNEYGGRIVGRVDNNGVIFDSDYGGNAIGRVELPAGSLWSLRLKAGAAYLLLFR